MVWKIVKTIEEGRSFITAVPHTWEKNGLLYWPPPGVGPIDKVRANLTLAPDETWAMYKCEVKIQRIDVFLEAKKLEKLLSNVETENEEDVMFNYELKKRKRNEPKMRLTQLDFNESLPQAGSSLPQASSSLVPSNSSTSTDCSGGSGVAFGSNMCSQQSLQTISFNSQTSSNSIDRIDTLLSNNSRERAHVPFTALPNTTNESLTVISSNQCPEQTSHISRSPSNSMMNYTDMLLSSDSPERTSEDLAPLSASISQQADVTMIPLATARQESDYLGSTQYKEEFKKFREETAGNFAALSAKIDRILRLMPTSSNTKETTPGMENVFSFPMRTVEEVSNFEAKLNSQDFRSKVFQQLAIVGGTTGKEDGFKIAAKLVDYMFTRAVQQQHTWTGCSKSSIKKLAFMKNTNIIDLFHSLVHAADHNFSLQSTEVFFKIKILKHGNARNTNKNK